MTTKLQNSLYTFFDHNRRTGSSTALIHAAQSEGGIIVVGTESDSKWMLNWAKMFYGENKGINFKVITVHQIQNGIDRGQEPQKVFIDVSAILPLLRENHITKVESDGFPQWWDAAH